LVAAEGAVNFVFKANLVSVAKRQQKKVKKAVPEPGLQP